MAKGIFNPYQAEQKKKKHERTPTNKELYVEEYGGPKKGNVKLDGDSFILELQHTDLEDVPARLGKLLYDVMEAYPETMIQHGINLMPLDATLKLDENELALPTPVGHVSVYVDKERNETEVFRRIAHALRLLPNSDILVKHKARVIVR